MYSFRYAICNLRPHNIYGPRMGLSHAVPQIMEKCCKIENGKPVEVFSPSHTRTSLLIRL